MKRIFLAAFLLLLMVNQTSAGVASFDAYPKGIYKFSSGDTGETLTWDVDNVDKLQINAHQVRPGNGLCSTGTSSLRTTRLYDLNPSGSEKDLVLDLTLSELFVKILPALETDNTWDDTDVAYESDEGNYICYGVRMTITGVNNTKTHPTFLVKVYGENLNGLDDFIQATQDNPTILFGIILVIGIVIFLYKQNKKK